MNHVSLTGRLTATPELKTTPSGIATTRITVAVNRMPNANGEKIADFINVIVWRKQAENVAKYCTKGSLVGIAGRIQTRNYNAQDGTKKYITEVLAEHIEFLGSKPKTETSTTQPTQVQTVQPQNETTVEEDPFMDFGSEVVINDDDLPF